MDGEDAETMDSSTEQIAAPIPVPTDPAVQQGLFAFFLPFLNH